MMIADVHTANARKLRYCEVHPESPMGDANHAASLGWRLVAIRPDGLMIYERLRARFLDSSILTYFFPKD